MKSCFFEKINRTDKPLTILTKKQKEKTQIINIRIEREDITQTLQTSKG